ncbi:MAG TPA: FAD/NAD(P)-binding protein [Methylocystis sp.]|nr:FAD/NAD(P)-binding protein [Methylocystis sp.]
MTEISGALGALACRLEALGACPSLTDLAETIETTELSYADVAPYVRLGRQTYNRETVIVRETYELLVLTWAPGQASIPHDHGASAGVMRVLQGCAAEGFYRIGADGYVDLEYEELRRVGEVSAFRDCGVHHVRNASTDGETLVTLHVYARPLRNVRQFVARPKTQSGARPAARDEAPTIAIVGGGFSGAMTAAQILRAAAAPLRVVLIERRGTMGEGVAYCARDPEHLLNVPARNMSAWPDRPQDFFEWARRRRRDTLPSDFLPREWYGDYIREALRDAAASAKEGVSLAMLFDEARRIERNPEGGWLLHLGSGPSLSADLVVLAVGHRPPNDPLGSLWTGEKTRFIEDPWRPYAMNAVRDDEPVVVIGSGLTAVDVTLTLAQSERTGVITLVSRHGLQPQGHILPLRAPADMQSVVSRLISAPGGVRTLSLLAEVRSAVKLLAEEGQGWRSVVDGLRPHTARLWRGMPRDERRRFLRHLRPFWEIHRHRMAPQANARLLELLESGKVQIVAGRVASVEANGSGARVFLRRRHAAADVELSAGWVVNCTGPAPSNEPRANPVIESLLLRGRLRRDDLGLGIETAKAGAALAKDGAEVDGLFVVGTLRKPAFWESTAVPELREQAAETAQTLLERLRLRERASVERAPRAVA